MTAANRQAPLRLTIPGQYWDSQLYMGRLYLWNRDGSVRTLKWSDLIETICADEELRLAVHCAFTQSEYLYGAQLKTIFRDREVLKVVTSKFERAAELSFELTSATMAKCTVGQQQSPFPFPHADVTLYYKKMYCASHDGLHVATCGRTKHPISTKPVRLWDGRATSISGSYRAMAVAAGSDGLFELPDIEANDEPRQISPKHASLCEWNYWSVYASSHISGGYLADFSNEQVPNEDYKHRELRRLLTADDVFHTPSEYSWGGKDKICATVSNRIKVSRYRPWDDERVLEPIGDVADGHGQLVSARVAGFGVVLEYDEKIVVVDSTSHEHVVDGTPVNWRVFPRSRWYENQLHVVYDDHLEVLSFNQDYFVDQDQKILGTKQSDFNRFPR